MPAISLRTGSERLKDAHGEASANPMADLQALTGLFTNYSLTMLGACVRALIEHRKKKSKGKFSYRAYMVDLVQLLQESLSGTASTACFVCLSQAPDNLTQSKFALDFGETFAMLSTRPQRTKPTPRAKLAKPAEKLLGEAEAVLARGGGGKFRAMREAQKRDCEQLLATLASFG